MSIGWERAWRVLKESVKTIARLMLFECMYSRRIARASAVKMEVVGREWMMLV